ncbi:Os08g0367625 [Oryza sativa Japonica Group]|uniref:Os08g0367625 protein n=1 Tax=Oryza sativa subsp. japonica TaxID=39947 RepID=A0A0P0XFL8_ORYSJ|nr:Os08g0367625 [Oryza sativa Japonica Group]
MEFVPPADPSMFFPISVGFSTSNTFSDVKVPGIRPLKEGSNPPKYSQRRLTRCCPPSSRRRRRQSATARVRVNRAIARPSGAVDLGEGTSKLARDHPRVATSHRPHASGRETTWVRTRRRSRRKARRRGGGGAHRLVEDEFAGVSDEELASVGLKEIAVVGEEEIVGVGEGARLCGDDELAGAPLGGGGEGGTSPAWGTTSSPEWGRRSSQVAARCVRANGAIGIN